MTREIKFRGKKFCQDEWIYGSLITRGELGADGNFIDTGRGECYPLQQDTIGQFTGLYDKNGKEIYEGDIVKTKYGRPCVIECLSTICFIGFDLRPEVPISKYKQLDGYDLYNSDNLEVIGNIYDNQELLKGGEV